MNTETTKRKIKSKKSLILSSLIIAIMLFCCSCGKSSDSDDKFNSALLEITNKDNGNPAGNESNANGSDNTENSVSNDGDTFGDGNLDNAGTNDASSNGNLGNSNLGNEDSDNTSSENDTPVIIVLDPGHGGIFTGAIYDGFTEKNMTLRVAQFIKDYLENNYKNVEVYLTRDSDMELSKDLVEELEMRAIFAKEKNANALVSLHFNASEQHDMDGATVYISRRENVNAPANELAENILQELLKLGLKRQGVLTRRSNDMFDENGEAYDYYAINRHCANRDLIGIIVEHCFMDCSTDKPYFNSDDALSKLAIADAEGIANYFKLIKK